MLGRFMHRFTGHVPFHIASRGACSRTQEMLSRNGLQNLPVRRICFANKNFTDSVKPVTSFYDRYVFPEPPSMITDDEHDKVIEKVNGIIQEKGRLFAIISVTGHQYKVTTGDIIRIVGRVPANCGDQIRLEKVNLVGGRDFSLLGKPVLPRKVAKVLATVIEKTPGEDIVTKLFTRRKRHERTYRTNNLYTVLRINEIQVSDNLE